MFTGDKFCIEYRQLLELMVPGIEFLTDKDWGLAAAKRYPGWWGKMELFAPWWRDLRPFFFLDLDTYVFCNLDTIAVDDKKFTMFKHLDIQKASGLMVIPKDVDDIWVHWKNNYKMIIAKHHGDQEYLGQFAEAYLPMKGIYSYKSHCRSHCPPDAKIVYFHGVPKPHEVGGWAGKVWQKYTSKPLSTTSETSTEVNG